MPRKKKSPPDKKPAPPWKSYPYLGEVHDPHEQGGTVAWLLWLDFLRETRRQEESIFRALERAVLPFYQALAEEHGKQGKDQDQILTWVQQAQEGGGPRRLQLIVETLVNWLVERLRLDRTWVLARPWLLGHVFSTVVWWDLDPNERERLAVHGALAPARRERRYHAYDPTRETRAEAEERLTAQIGKPRGESLRVHTEFIKGLLEDDRISTLEHAEASGLRRVRGKYQQDHMTWLVRFQVQRRSFRKIAQEYGRTEQAVSQAIHGLAAKIDRLPLRPH